MKTTLETSEDKNYTRNELRWNYTQNEWIERIRFNACWFQVCWVIKINSKSYRVEAWEIGILEESKCEDIRVEQEFTCVVLSGSSDAVEAAILMVEEELSTVKTANNLGGIDTCDGGKYDWKFLLAPCA